MEAAGSGARPQSGGLGSSFDSRDDQELYARLMSERQRIQRQHEERKRQKAVRVKQAKPAVSLEERERGFQLYISGANEERAAEEARRLRQARRRPSGGLPGAGGGGADAAQSQWQMATVEFKGKDGQVYRSSPNGFGEGVWSTGCADGGASEQIEEEEEEELSDGGSEEICEDITDGDVVVGGGGAAGSRPGTGGAAGSRPGTGASVSSLDQDTRGVLRMMHTADKDQLVSLRACLTKHIAGNATPKGSAGAGGGGAAPPVRVLRHPGRPGSGGADAAAERSRPPSVSASAVGAASERSRPPSASSSSAVMSAIQAENARARRLAEGGSKEGCDVPELAASRPSSRPSSKAGRRLPLSPEVAAECAPPSALSASSSAPASAAPRGSPPEPPAAAPRHPAQAPAALPGGPPGAPGASCPWGAPRPGGGAYPASAGALAPPVPVAVPRLSSPSAPGSGARPPAAPAPPLAPNWGAGAPVSSAAAAGSEGAGRVDIVDRVRRLDTRKQKALLRVLESLEAESPAQDVLEAPAPPRGEEAPGAPERGAAACEGADVANGALRVRVLSNWGDARQCGLSLLEALDESAEVMRIPRASVSLRGTQSGANTLPRVLEGRPDTTSEKQMWLATLCPRDGGGFEPVEIVLSWPAGLAAPSALRLWNFNSPDGLDKGARRVEVCRGADAVWSGELPRGTGSCHAASALAPLRPGFAAPAGAAAPRTPTGAGRPIWLGEAPAERAGGRRPEEAAGGWGDEDDDGDGPPAPLAASPAPRRSPSPQEEELEKSLLALEKFRSSQSRRFFSAAGTALGASSPEPQQEEAQAADGDAPSEPLLAELQGLGLDVPIREFDDRDALDGLCGEDAVDWQPTLGSSLVNFNPNESQSVVIPTLPRGRTLVLNCVSTWGDTNFVGLAGIELFDARGLPVVPKDPRRQVSADPYSINVLPEYEDDPRTPDKLFDQVNLTRDDLHVWLAPFTPGQAHTVTVDLERQTAVSMIRIWNYNKSRQHSSRGVKDLEILLDGLPVFVGEIRRAPGVLTSPEEACEHILFTQDEAVLLAVEEHDWLPGHLPMEDDVDDDTFDEPSASGPSSRAGGEKAARAAPSRPATAESGAAAARTGVDGRPLTRASDRQLPRGVLCESITLVLHSTWGDPYYAGLTALEVLDASLTPVPLEARCISASPADLNDLEGVEGDPRTIDKLLDGTSCTTDDLHMWLAPFVKPERAASGRGSEAAVTGNIIKIDLETRREVAGFHIWNYNKSPEDAVRGVKEFSVYCDDRYVAAFLCRKAPGHVNFDFKQVVLLDQPPCDAVRRPGALPPAPRVPSRGRGGRPPTGTASGAGARERSSSRDRARAPSQERPRSRGAPATASAGAGAAAGRAQQQYETPLHPCGFVFKLLLLDTWSDVHYVGLDGVELYDLEGRPLRPKRVHSSRGSVRDLPGMENDSRTEESLLHGAPGTSGRMWLAPFARHPPNSVELVFDEPTQISAVHIWNYTRTPSRGVRDVEIYVDDLLIYQGILRQRTPGGDAAGRAAAGRCGEAVLFTALPEIVEREKPFVYLPSADELVAFFDERGRLDQGGGCPGDALLVRPMTAVTRAP